MPRADDDRKGDSDALVLSDKRALPERDVDAEIVRDAALLAVVLPDSTPEELFESVPDVLNDGDADDKEEAATLTVTNTDALMEPDPVSDTLALDDPDVLSDGEKDALTLVE